MFGFYYTKHLEICIAILYGFSWVPLGGTDETPTEHSAKFIQTNGLFEAINKSYSSITQILIFCCFNYSKIYFYCQYNKSNAFFLAGYNRMHTYCINTVFYR